MFAFVVFGLVFQYQAKRLAGKNVFKMTYFMSGGTQNLKSINPSASIAI